MVITRRQFVRRSIAAPALLTFGAAAPRFLLHAAAGGDSSLPDNVLVVIQLTGGNDGLNTIVPYAHDVYRQSRPGLSIPSRRVIRINDELGFHPALVGFAELLEANQLAIVQGVGYPQPNRSHFESMDIWHTGRHVRSARDEGWLGRSLHVMQSSVRTDVPALHLGEEEQPLALASRSLRIPSVSSLDEFRLKSVTPGSVPAIGRLASLDRESRGELLGFVQSSTMLAVDVSERLQSALRGTPTGVTYPQSALAKKLQTVAQLIKSGLDTRVYYLTIDGFDTHAQQAAAHAALLGQLGDALSAFSQELVACDQIGRVLTVCFSEFGRRVAENASEGTDHGTAAPMFLVGGRVRSGLIGEHPSLEDLDAGDLRFHTDFRQVYAAVLEHWLGCESRAILGDDYAPVPMIAG